MKQSTMARRRHVVGAPECPIRQLYPVTDLCESMGDSCPVRAPRGAKSRRQTSSCRHHSWVTHQPFLHAYIELFRRPRRIDQEWL